MKRSLLIAMTLSLSALAGGAGAQPAPPLGGIAMAQQSSPNPFSALVGEKRERRVDRQGRAKVERYVLATDNRALLIQSRTRTARVKFLCGPDDTRLDCQLDPENAAEEIFLLTVTRGPRGDLIFKNAEGETYVRLASYGGATVFWPGEAQGIAASKSFGDDRSLELEEHSIETVRRRANAATAYVSAVTGAPISFDISDVPTDEGNSFAVLADAVVRTAIGMRNVSADPTGARILADRISRVTFEMSSAPSIAFDDGALIVSYVPDQDIAGRPSSRAVERFLEESL